MDNGPIEKSTAPLKITPPKINIEPENNGLEDDFPFPGVFSGSMLIFRGVTLRLKTYHPKKEGFISQLPFFSGFCCLRNGLDFQPLGLL